MPMRTGLLCAVLALCAHVAMAASPPAVQPLRVADNAAPTFSVYTTRDGLSDEIWSTVGIDRNGFAWAGSASSLARFDGYRWTALRAAPARGLVRDMERDDDGTLWAIFERDGLARYDGTQWELPGEPRYFHRFSTTVDNGRRTLWAAHDAGLLQLVDGVWRDSPRYATARGTRAVAIARTDTLGGGAREWLGTATHGLWVRDANDPASDWERYPEPLLDDTAVSDLLRTGSGADEALWVLTYGSGLVRLRADGNRAWRADRGELPSEALYSMLETRDSSGESLLWVASRAGLLRVRGEQIDVFDRRHGLPSDAVRGIKLQHGPDGIDLLWLATEGGMARAALADNPWRTVSLIGARENGVFGLMLEPDGRGGERLWVGSAKEGLRLLEQGHWREFTQANGALPQRAVRGIWRLPGPDGRMHRILGLLGAGLLEIDDALDVVPLATPWPVHRDDTLTAAVARSDDGVLEWWIGTLRSGVFRLRDGVWQPIRTRDGDAPWNAMGLTEQIDAAGRSWLWSTGPQGLARFDGSAWERLPDALGLRDEGARAMTLFGERNPPELWVSTNRNGVVRLDVADPRHPRVITDGSVPPAPDPTVYSTLRDAEGRVYVCTNNGVQQLTPQPDGSYTERVFRRRDGLVHDECNTNSQLIDSSGRYWVGTLGGLGMFDPRAQPVAAVPRAKALQFSAVQVDGIEHMLPDDVPLQLPSTLRELRIDYTLLAGMRENESRYRTELVGYDPAPTPWSADRSRSFAHLPPGVHVLRVDARDYTGTPATPRTLEFTVAPQWWQRATLQALIAALVLLTAFGAVMTYNRGLRHRQRQLLGDVAARTAELRAANERLTELSYLDPLTGVANRRRLTEAMAAAIARAQAQRLPLGLIVADVDHFKIYNDRHGHLAGDVALRAVAHALQSAVREHDLVARFGGEEFACLMIDADRDHVLRTAERMRALVEALPPRSLGNEDDGITLSAGVLQCVPAAGERPDHLLRAADEALYAAKKAGRNRVMVASAGGARDVD